MFKIIITFILTTFLTLLSTQTYAFQFNLFGDVTYQSSSEKKSFQLGAINLNAEENISETTHVIVEILFEDTDHGYETDAERFSITKDFDDSQITLGKFSDPLGFWNFNFHHGTLSQDTIHRPTFLELENQHEGIFPSHLVGILAGGETGGFLYQLAFANSNGINTDHCEDPTPPATAPATCEHLELKTININDPSTEKTTVLRISYTFFDNLTIGLMSLKNDVVETGEESLVAGHGDVLIEQTVIGLEYSFTAGDFYSFGELYQIDYTDNQNLTLLPNLSTETYSADAYYFQVGYKVTDKLRTAYRYENLDFDPNNGAFFTMIELAPDKRHVLALNYRLEESHSLRFEFDRHQSVDDVSHSVFSVQWFFLLL